MVAWLVTWDRHEGRMSWGKPVHSVVAERGQGPNIPQGHASSTPRTHPSCRVHLTVPWRSDQTFNTCDLRGTPMLAAAKA